MTTIERDVRAEPVAGAIGAEIHGVDLAGDLDDARSPTSGSVAHANKVIFFRDQHLDYEGQVAFARRLGPLTIAHPTIQSPPDQPFLDEVDSAKGARRRWHTDVTFLDQPVSFTFLRGVVIPEVGGDTVWANTVNAYETLSPELRDARRHAAHRAHQRAPRHPHRRRPGRIASGVGRERAAVRVDGLPGRAPGGARASRDRRARAAARRVRAPGRRIPE